MDVEVLDEEYSAYYPVRPKPGYCFVAHA